MNSNKLPVHHQCKATSNGGNASHSILVEEATPKRARTRPSWGLTAGCRSYSWIGSNHPLFCFLRQVSRDGFVMQKAVRSRAAARAKAAEVVQNYCGLRVRRAEPP